MVAAERLRFVDRREPETVALVGVAGPQLGRSGIGILNRDGSPGEQSVLAIVGGVREGVGHAEVEALAHPPTKRNRHAVVDAGSRAFELVDGTQLGNGTGEIADAGRIGTG